jgi:hypothetical protein
VLVAGGIGCDKEPFPVLTPVPLVAVPPIAAIAAATETPRRERAHAVGAHVAEGPVRKSRRLLFRAQPAWPIGRLVGAIRRVE